MVGNRLAHLIARGFCVYQNVSYGGDGIKSGLELSFLLCVITVALLFPFYS